MKKHWQTTALGIVLIIGALSKAAAEALQGQHVDMTVLIGGLTAGLGFLRTPDANKVQEKG